MRMSQLLFKTEKESPADARLISHRLLLRAGLVKQVSAGVYSLTPLAWRILQRISEIARSEMNRIGGQEILLPVAQPASLWEETGRYETIDASLVRWRDRSGLDMVLAMTNEEAVTDLVRHVVHSYRQLPIAVYQIQTKYRDEARPRGGLIRLREFLMKDAYSFHRDADSLAKYYAQMSEAYESFYRRCGIETIKVESDTGMMGGGVAHEFMLLSAGHGVLRDRHIPHARLYCGSKSRRRWHCMAGHCGAVSMPPDCSGKRSGGAVGLRRTVRMVRSRYGPV